jgi:hypothetical protein
LEEKMKNIYYDLEALHEQLNQIPNNVWRPAYDSTSFSPYSSENVADINIFIAQRNLREDIQIRARSRKKPTAGIFATTKR